MKDVSFEVQPGEVVGIIGRNGAGKSTLLKILSRITDPSVGRAEVHGRVGSLLEVGTGFHPELTGRDNVYLNGSILGMDRAYITRKFDEIVAFSGVEKFIDTPVKRYSSGMYLRLAFAVAAHLEPEILIVDEVLAVGDADFQRKCLQKMEDVGREGRAVLFVSHDVGAISRLCSRTLVLDGGQVVFDGPSPAAVRFYGCLGAGSPALREWPDPDHAPGDAHARLVSVRVTDQGGRTADTFDVRDPVLVELRYLSRSPELRLVSNFQFFDEWGHLLFLSADFSDRAWWAAERRPGEVRAVCMVPGNFLAEGRVSVLAAVTSYEPAVVHALERDAVSFTMIDHSAGDGVRGPWHADWPGLLRPMLPWGVEAPGYRSTVEPAVMWPGGAGVEPGGQRAR
ncbi:MAG TPA: ABC transporter ATP-binding protein [Longimicrobium sp.]